MNAPIDKIRDVGNGIAGSVEKALATISGERLGFVLIVVPVGAQAHGKRDGLHISNITNPKTLAAIVAQTARHLAVTSDGPIDFTPGEKK